MVTPKLFPPYRSDFVKIPHFKDPHNSTTVTFSEWLKGSCRHCNLPPKSLIFDTSPHASFSSTPLHPKTWFNKKKATIFNPPNHTQPLQHLKKVHAPTSPRLGIPNKVLLASARVPIRYHSLDSKWNQRAASVPRQWPSGSWVGFLDENGMLRKNLYQHRPHHGKVWPPKTWSTNAYAWNIHSQKKEKNIHYGPLEESKCAGHIKSVKVWNRFCWGDMFFFPGSITRSCICFWRTSHK